MEPARALLALSLTKGAILGVVYPRDPLTTGQFEVVDVTLDREAETGEGMTPVR